MVRMDSNTLSHHLSKCIVVLYVMLLKQMSTSLLSILWSSIVMMLGLKYFPSKDCSRAEICFGRTPWIHEVFPSQSYEGNDYRIGKDVT